jgi:hypothetical protein
MTEITADYISAEVVRALRELEDPENAGRYLIASIDNASPSNLIAITDDGARFVVRITQKDGTND